MLFCLWFLGEGRRVNSMKDVDMTEQRGTHEGYYGGLGQILPGYNIRCIRLLPEPDGDPLGEEVNTIWADGRTIEAAVHNAGIEQGDYIQVVYADDHHINIEKL